MWRVIAFIFFGIVFCFASSAVTQNASATSNPTWLSDSIVRLGEIVSDKVSEDAKICGGRQDVITLMGETINRQACTFGSMVGTRMARYRDVNNEFSYAIAFASDSSFSRVKSLCPGLDRCVYSQVGNTLLLQIPEGNGRYRYSLIKDFTKHLRRIANYYQFEYLGPYPHLGAGNKDFAVGATGISANGRWAVIELIDQGLIRMDLRTLEFKRVVAYGSQPTRNNQSLEVTISDDGGWVAAVGYMAGTLLYEINDFCGDILVEASTQNFSNGITPCKSSTLRTAVIVNRFVASYIPRFSGDGRRLLLNIETQTQSLLITFAPAMLGSGNPYYLAFGDSYSSGEGETDDKFYTNSTNTLINHCHVSSRSYPYLLGNYWDIIASNRSCSGAVMPDIRIASRTFLQGDMSQWPSVISLGVGGNDIDFMGKLKNCIGVGTCEWATAGKRQSTAQEIKELFPKLVDLITEMKINYSPASFFVVGYPSVINDLADASCSITIGSLLDVEERRYMSEAINYLNKVLRAAADYTKVKFVDIETAFHGERLCDEKETAMNGIRYGDDMAPIPMIGNLKLIGAESFHPTPRGHQLTAQYINAQLGSFWTSPACVSCTFDDSRVAIGDYWLEGVTPGEPIVRQLASVFLNPETLLRASKISFNFISDMFAPNSTVRFELHSDIQQLGVFMVNDDGSLQGELPLPDGVSGYHTIHAYGESRSGEKLDMYQTVFIDTESSGVGINARQGVDTLVGGIMGGDNNSEASSVTKVASNNTGAVGVQGADNKRLSSPAALTGVSHHSSYGTNLWWYVLGLASFGVLLLGLAFLFSRRNNKTLPSYDDR